MKWILDSESPNFWKLFGLALSLHALQAATVQKCLIASLLVQVILTRRHRFALGERAILLPSNKSPEILQRWGLPCTMTDEEVSTFAPKDQVFSRFR